jgi:cyanophycinase
MKPAWSTIASGGLASLLLLTGTPGLDAQARGNLFIVGGGEQSPQLVEEFVALAGAPGGARIAVIPMASEEAEATGIEKAEELREFGATAWVVNLTRDEALDPASRGTLDSATGIWFTGGDQARLAPVLLGTPALAAMKARYLAGAVVGGTSAGAAIMSDSMLTGNQRRPDSLGYYGDEYPAIARATIEVVPGLGFLHGAIVDQHFIRRERHNRLLSVVLERPGLLGVGIDEGTALLVQPDGRWRVLGASAVEVIDGRRATVTGPAAPLLGAINLRLFLLPAGSRFDPRSGKATLPGP